MATATQLETVVGVFADTAAAQRAVNDLRAAGFTENQIGVVSHHTEGIAKAKGHGDKMGEGAVAGLATGAGIGALWGLAIVSGITLPVIGPAIAAGTMGILLSSAAAGAAAAGVAGALIGMGIPDEDAAYYQREFETGRTVVTVKAGNRTALAHDIFVNDGGYDRASGTSI